MVEIIRKKSKDWRDDVVQSLYFYIFKESKEEIWADLEIEAKLGKIFFHLQKDQDYSRIEEIFIVPKSKSIRTNFISDVGKKGFISLFCFMNNKSLECGTEIVKLKNMKTKDYDSKQARKTVELKESDDNLEEKVIQVQKKKNKKNHDIRNSGNDIRITISQEKKFPLDLSLSYSGYSREKNRVSFMSGNYRIDFTIVNSFQNEVNKGTSYEVEMEFIRFKDLAHEYKKNKDQFKIEILYFCDTIVEYYKILNDCVDTGNQDDNEKIVKQNFGEICF